MITNAQQILTKAHQDNYAVLHVNVINYDMAACAIQTAQKANAPIIVAVSENALKKCFCGAGDFADMINKIDAYFHITVPVIIHLDHGKYETVETCIKSGFTSVMFDGSKLPFVENYAQTQKIVNLARLHNVSVEAEVGIIGGKKDDDKKAGELADINECQQMAQLGITSLAAGIGNIHGVYPSD
jgi:fructose-bisphosphate aldolase class II